MAGLELLAVTVGPGNFTGLRAGIAVARALGLALGCPALGLGTLEAIAQAAAALAPGNPPDRRGRTPARGGLRAALRAPISTLWEPPP